MRLSRTAACAAVLASTAALLLVAPAAASAAAPADSCRTVSAYGIGQDLGEGATAAVVFGDPIVTGTTRGQFNVTGVDDAVLSIAGTVDFRLHRGDLNTQVSGTFDTASGKFSATTTSLSGTRGLSRVTGGGLTLSGTQDAQGRFTETIRGTLCDLR